MGTYILIAVALTISVTVVAIALRRGRGRAQHEAGPIRRALYFIGGPFPLSIALHVAGLLFLIVSVHETRGRDLIMVNMEAGGGGGSGSEMDNLDVPATMPEVAPQFESAAADSPDLKGVTELSASYARSENGIGTGRGPGIGPGTGPGIGRGFGGFIGKLRRQGLDVVIVIDGTDSMRMVMDDVKARMNQILGAIHHLVPTARIGVVVYGGAEEPIDVQPLTLSSAKLDAFVTAIQTKGGGEWEENLAGAIETAVNRMDWRPYAHKVIVVVGDAPPKPAQFASILELAKKFRAEDGILNTVDVTAQEHERFEREFAIQVHRTEPGESSPLPAFYQQTRAAYVAIAHAGGGSMKSLEGDDKVNQQVLMLAFGDTWAEQVVRFAPMSETARR